MSTCIVTAPLCSPELDEATREELTPKCDARSRYNRNVCHNPAAYVATLWCDEGGVEQHGRLLCKVCVEAAALGFFGCRPCDADHPAYVTAREPL